MRTTTNKNCKSGAALLIVLFVIMVITLVGMGFIAKTDSELACGNNMVLRTQMDNLAKSGLEHARGLLINPWDVSVSSGKYWLGQTAIQFDGGNDYYDIEIVKDSTGTTPRSQYSITSTGYRMRNGEVVGQSCLNAKLRFDPAVAIWCESMLNLTNGYTINGDAYSELDFMNDGATINGDVYSSYVVMNAGTITGQISEFAAQRPVEFSNINYANFTTNYNHEDGSTYSVTAITPGTYSGQTWNYSAFNPAGVFYCNGNLTLNGNMTINGMLVVNGILTISGTNNIIVAVRNYPAVVVNGGLTINTGTALTVNGLVQVRDDVSVPWGAVNVNVRINGALFVRFGPMAWFTSSMGSFVVNADPIESAIQIWPSSTPGQPYRWVSAGGAYVKNVSR